VVLSVAFWPGNNPFDLQKAGKIMLCGGQSTQKLLSSSYNTRFIDNLLLLQAGQSHF
jgi:hypothetical protein